MTVSNELKLSRYQVDYVTNLVKFVIKKYSDLNKHDQYNIFAKLTRISLLKNEFFDYRDKVIDLLKGGFDPDDERMHFYVSTDLPHTHLEITESMKQVFSYWDERFKQEIEKVNPDDQVLKDVTQLMLATSERVSKLALGTPVMVWVQRKVRLMQKTNKAISIKDFGAELSTNKYNTDSSKIDTLNNGSTAPSIPTNITKSEQQRGKDGGSVRLSGTGKGQHIQNSSSSSTDKTGVEGVQGSDSGRKTEKLF